MSDRVLTLVAAGRLNGEHVEAALAELRGVGRKPVAPDWLTPGTACDVAFEGSAEGVEEAARARFKGERVDLAVLDATGRRKRLLVADLESTVIRNEMLDELAALAGVGERVAEITAQAMNGELGFEQALRERVGLLKGLPAEIIERARGSIEIDPGARTLVAVMRRAGAYAALVTGGFGCFAEPLRTDLGFDVQHSNDLLIEDGRLSGAVGEPILGREAKLMALDELCRKLAIGREQTLAVGDGANDLAMIAAAGLGVAYRAKPRVRRAAPCRVDHGDLSTLLYYQGYRAAEVAAA